MKSHDPYGGAAPGEIYSPKAQVLQFIDELQRKLAKLRRSMRRQDEILNDATRAAVYRELIADLRQQAGDARYSEAYQVAGMKEMGDRLEGWIGYLTKYGWAEKFTLEGEPKSPTFEDFIEEAYVRDGARGVAEFLRKTPGAR